MQASVEHHLPGARIMVLDQRLGVVEQDLLGQAVEVEGAFQSFKPSRLALMAERLNVNAARIAKGGGKQVNPHARVADHHPALAEVDLQLTPRRRLEACGRQRFRREFTPQVRDRAFNRAQADGQAQLNCQLLTQYVSVAAVTAEPLRQPCRMLGQNTWPFGNEYGAPPPARDSVGRSHGCNRVPLQSAACPSPN